MKPGRPYIRLFYRKPKVTIYRSIVRPKTAVRLELLHGQTQIENTIIRTTPILNPIPADGPQDVYTYKKLQIPQTKPDGEATDGRMNKIPSRPTIGMLSSGLSELSQAIKSSIILKRIAERRQMSQSRVLLKSTRRGDSKRMSSLWKPVVTKPRSETNSLFSQLFTANRLRAAAIEASKKRKAVREAREAETEAEREVNRMAKLERRWAAKTLARRQKRMARTRRKARMKARMETQTTQTEPGSQGLRTDGSMFSKLFDNAKAYLPETENDASTAKEAEEAEEGEGDGDLLVDVSAQDFAAFANVPEVDAQSEEEYWILNGTSKSLVASDFQRLVKGIHIKTWDRPLMVYQAYNPATYAPLDQYVLKFRNPGEALAFKMAFEAPDTRESPHFSLAPPNSERALSLNKIEKSLRGTPAFNLAGAVKKRLGAPHVVHVRLEHGDARVWEIQEFIRDDGEARGNMEWRVHRPYQLMKPQGREKTASADKGRLVRRPAIIALARADELKAYTDAKWMDTLGDHPLQAKRRGRGNFQKNFAIGFEDHDEARRFARRWHRRFVTLGGTGEVLMNVKLLNGGFEAYH